jgi:hypothetical protein
LEDYLCHAQLTNQQEKVDVLLINPVEQVDVLLTNLRVEDAPLTSHMDKAVVLLTNPKVVDVL